MISNTKELKALSITFTAGAILLVGIGHSMDKRINLEYPKLLVVESGKPSVMSDVCKVQNAQIRTMEKDAGTIADSARLDAKATSSPESIEEHDEIQAELNAANTLLRQAVEAGNNMCKNNGITFTIKEE